MSKIFQSKPWAELNQHLNPIWIGGNLFFRTGGVLYAKGNIEHTFTIKEKFVIKMCKTKLLHYFSKPNIEYIADLTKEKPFSKWTRKIIRGALKKGFVIKEEIDMNEARALYVKNFKDHPDSYWNNLKELSKSIGIFLEGKLIGFITYMNQEDECYMVLHCVDKERIGEGNYLLVSSLFDYLRAKGIKLVSCGDAERDSLAYFKAKFFDEVPCFDYTNDCKRKIKWGLAKWNPTKEKK